MEEELNKVLATAPEIEDMPDFGEETAEMPCEGEESVNECTDIPENENVSEETEAETEEETPDSEADTTTEAEKTDEKSVGSAEKKEEELKNNLPSGFSFNPLQLAIRPLYEKAIAEDELFAKEVKEKESRAEKPKSLAECADYLMGEAYHYASEHRNGNFGLAGMPDDEMLGLIKHYYDEDNIVIRKIGAGTRAKVATTANAGKAKADTKKGKDKAKAENKPAPPKNVVDITKAITAKKNTTDADGKKKKAEKKKDNLLAGFIPMERPDAENYEKEAKKGSRQQAKSVEQMDLFADFFSE